MVAEPAEAAQGRVWARLCAGEHHQRKALRIRKADQQPVADMGG